MSWSTLSRVEKAKICVAAKLDSPWLTNDQHADELGISPSTFLNLLYDPDGSKQKRRRERYRGKCIVCGAVTQSDGTKNPSKRCRPCSFVLSKRWTKEAVVEAIHLWAKEHGGAPPLSTDWNRPGRDRRFPSLSAVYGKGNKPFESWADAIEAAGLPRPRRGHKTKKRDRSWLALQREIVGRQRKWK